MRLTFLKSMIFMPFLFAAYSFHFYFYYFRIVVFFLPRFSMIFMLLAGGMSRNLHCSCVRCLIGGTNCALNKVFFEVVLRVCTSTAPLWQWHVWSLHDLLLALWWQSQHIRPTSSSYLPVDYSWLPVGRVLALKFDSAACHCCAFMIFIYACLI